MTRVPRAGRRIAFSATAALAMSLLFLHACRRAGRLSRDLQYDDVVYAVEAANRLDAAMSGGLPALLRTFVEAPPHSFLASLQALAAFALGGVRDVSLYASNAWILVALAAAIAFALRARPAAVTAVALAFALTSPLAYFTIAEFRPDIALGLATALMAWALVDAAFREDGRGVGVAGLLLAAALVIKSTFFPHTLAIALGLVAALLLAARARGFGWMPRVAFGARQAALFLGLGIGLALPFYLLNGVHTLDYFWSNTLGSRGAVWNYEARLPVGEVLDRFKPLVFAMGRLQSLAALVVAAAGGILLWRRGDRAGSLRIATLLGAAILSTAIIVLGRQPSQFFFATTHWLLLLAAIQAFAALHDAAGTTARRALDIGGAATVVVLAFANSTFHDVSWPPGADHGDSWNERVVGRVADDLHAMSPAGPLPAATVLVASATAVNSETLTWVARLAGLRIAAPQVQLVSDLGTLQGFALRADYVVVPEPSLMPHDGFLPIGRLQRPLHEWLASDGRFEPLGADDARQPYFLYGRRDRRADLVREPVVTADMPIVKLEHFRGEEGPYRDRQPALPRMRWIEGKDATLCAALRQGTRYEVRFAYGARTPGTVSLLHGNDVLAKGALENNGFGEVRGHFTARGGADCIRIEIEAPDNEIPLYVLATRLALDSAPLATPRPPPASPVKTEGKKR